MNYSVGERIITKKVHPCGSGEWEIIRVGADIKIKCLGCGRIVMVGLDKFPKLIKKHIVKD